MKLKRFAAAALVFCLVLTLLPAGVSAAMVGPDEDGWGLSSENGVLTLTVTKDVYAESGSFWNARALEIEQVEIGPDVAVVSGAAFSECANLRSFKVDQDNATFSAGDDGVLYTLKKDELVCYPAAASGIYAGKSGRYMVPESVVKVRLSAFSGLINSGNPLEIYALDATRTSVASYRKKWSGDDFPDGTITYVPVTGVSLYPETLRVEIDKTGELTAQVLPEDATFQEVSWSSEPEAFAAVAGSGEDGSGTAGTVTGVSAGTSRIVVTTADGEHTASCLVTVVKNDVNGLELSDEALTLGKGETADLTAKLKPFNATNKNISFHSTDTSVAVISDPARGDAAAGAVTIEAEEDGDEEDPAAIASITVTAVDPGTASIVVTTADGDYYAVCKVTVKAPEFTLSESKLELTITDTDPEPTAALTALDADGVSHYEPVRWYSSDDGIVTVSEESGASVTVTAHRPGTAAIVARTDDGRQQSCAVTVYAAPTGAAMSMSALTLAPEAPDNTWQLYAVISPSTAKQEIVGWESSDDSRVSVTRDGLITALENTVKDNPVIITATFAAADANGDPVTAACEVTVETPVKSVWLKREGEPGSVSDLSLDETDNTSARLEAVVEPGTATDDSVKWYSSNEDVATVDSNGLVTAQKAGTARIIAVTNDGGKTAECTVTVNATRVTGVRLNERSLTLGLSDRTAALTATVEPAGAAYQTIGFSKVDPDGVIDLSFAGPSGTVTAKALGETATVTVTVTTKDGGTFSDTCDVTVVPTAVESVKVVPGALPLIEGTAGETSLAVQIIPAVSVKETRWESSNTDVATVDVTDGAVTVKAHKAGTALITATVTDDLGQEYTASCAVTVSPRNVVSLTLADTDGETSAKLTPGVKKSLTASLSPYNATNKKITFLSTDPSVVELNALSGRKVEDTVIADAEGGSEGNAASVQVELETRKPGTADIIAVTEDGAIMARYTVTVYRPVTQVSIRQQPGTLSAGESAALKAVVTPEDAPQDVVWSSSDDTVATVDQYGVVTAHKSGTAVITAASRDYPDIYDDTCTVTVRVPVGEIELSQNSAVLELNNSTEQAGKLSLTATLKSDPKPSEQEDAPPEYETPTNLKVHWYSSDPLVAKVEKEDTESGETVTVTAVEPGTAVIIAAADDNGMTASCTVTVRNTVDSVALSKPSLRLMKGETAALTATVYPATAYQGVEWTSSEPGKVTVKNGVIEVLAAAEVDDEVTITAASIANPEITAACTVTVVETVVPAESVSLNKNTLTLNMGGKETLTPTITPDEATDKNVSWISTNTDVATVSDGGEVTAIKSGTATIIVTTGDGGRMDYCAVTVLAPVTGVTLNRTEMTISMENRAGEPLIAVVEPDDAANKDVTFDITEGADVIALSGGSGNTRRVIPVSEGKAKVTVTADGGATAVCEITVVPGAVDTVEMARSLVLVPTQTYTLSASFDLSDGSAGTLVWSSSDPEVATVGQRDGVITAIKVGTVLITATVTDGLGREYTASCAVTVKPIHVDQLIPRGSTSVRLDEGQTTTLSVDVDPANATNPAVVWHSTDKTAATVEQDGTVTAVGPGTATIVATAKDGGATASYEVTVTGERALTLDENELTLVLNRDEKKTASLTATIHDSGLEGLEVEWKPSRDGVVTITKTADGADITAVAEGTVTIIASVTRDAGSDNQKTFTATCDVTVLIAATELKIKQGEQYVGELTLVKDTSADLTAEVTPGEASNKAVTWRSLNPAVARVMTDGDGNVAVNAVASGRTAIIAITEDGAAASCVVTVQEKIDGLTLTPRTLRLTTGEEAALAAIVTPAGADQSVTWDSSDRETVSVTGNGVVKAEKATRGSPVTITATAADGRYETCTVTVEDPPPETVAVTKVKLDRTTLELDTENNTTGTLKAGFEPEEPTNKALIWSSNNVNVATVEGGENGAATVTAQTPGKAVITVTTADGLHTATCAVTVSGVEAADIQIERDGAVITGGLKLTLNDIIQLSATVLPSNAADKTVIWKSNDTNIATISSSGLLRAVKVGTATITAATANGVVDACVVTVEAPPPEQVPVTEVALDKPALVMKKDDSMLLTASVNPDNATDKTVTWRSDNTDVANVDQQGKVTAVAPGEARIYATAGTVSTSCGVTVLNPVTALELRPETLVLAVGDQETLVAELKAEADTIPPSDPTVIWRSSDDSIVTVTGGIVTAKKSGKATITAISVENGGCTDSCVVTVPGLSLTVPSALPVGRTAPLTAVQTPDGLDGTVTWTSSAPSIARVTDDGSVEGLATGTAKLTAKLEAGGVTVSAEREIAIIANVTHLSLDRSSLTFGADTESPADLTVTVETSSTQETALDLAVKYTPLDGGDPIAVSISKNHVSVSEDNSGTATVTVTAKAPGTALITVTATDAGGGEVCSADCVVIVPSVPVKSVSLDASGRILKPGDAQDGKFELAAALETDSGKPATNQKVEWLSSDKNVADFAVDEEDPLKITVTAENPGKATITVVTLDGGKTASCEIIVPEITLSKGSLELCTEGTAELFAFLTPGGLGNVEWSWSPSGGVAVTEDAEDGSKATVKAGETSADSAAVTVTATINAGGETVTVSKTCTVKVEQSAISLNRDSLVLAVDHEKLLTVTGSQTVDWNSSNDEVATVENGLVYAKGPGTATITATAGTAAATCTVLVTGYTVSPNGVDAPAMIITENTDGSKTVELTAADENKIYYTIEDTGVQDQEYDTSIRLTENAVIKAYAVKDGDKRSVTVTGYIFVSDGKSRPIVTDSMGNALNTAAEALAEGTVTANVTLSAEAAAKASDLYLAVYDTRGALIALEQYEAKLNGTGGQVISQIFDLDIPRDTEVGLIRLMVLSKDKAPVMSTGTLSG